MQEKASNAAEGTAFLSGGVVEGWLAKNLRGDMRDGLGGWSKEDIAAFLKSGRNAHSAAFGGMAQVVEDSTQHLSDADLSAIAAYLKSLPPARDKPEPALAYDGAAAQALRTGKDQGEGRWPSSTTAPPAIAAAARATPRPSRSWRSVPRSIPPIRPR